MILLVLFLSLFGGCASNVADKADHCYLCEGLSYDGPCLVDLATGNVAELAPGKSSGYAAFSYCGEAVIRTLAGEYSEAAIPMKNGDVNSYYFCDDCLQDIAEVADGGYVLADIHDLDNVRLYEIEADAVYETGNQMVIVTEAETIGQLLVRVTPSSEKE